MIDTHAHLENILCDTKGEIDKIILASSDFESSKNNLKLANKYDFLYPTIGIHPQSPADKIDKLEDLINKKVVAIGECGLDYSEDDFDKNNQIINFKKQIGLAQKYSLPLIIHARKAVDETIDVLSDYKNISGVFHCYAGGNKRIKKILNLGDCWFFGIDGNLTYEVGLVDVVKNIPKDKLILETDCPYLTPVPFRGQENKPAYIKYIYQKVAEIWDMSLRDTEKKVDDNAKRLFTNILK
jgi:TatD DNase family protein